MCVYILYVYFYIANSHFTIISFYDADVIFITRRSRYLIETYYIGHIITFIRG